MFPAKSAGTMCAPGRCNGKLYGPKTTIIPSGLNRIAECDVPTPSLIVQRRFRIASIALSTLVMADWTSRSLSQSGLPDSSVIVLAIAGRLACRKLAYFLTSSILVSSEVCDQLAKDELARWTAFETSRLVAQVPDQVTELSTGLRRSLIISPNSFEFKT